MGAGDVIGQVGTDRHRHTGKLLRHQGGQVGFEHVLQDHLDVVKAGQRFFQHRRQALVHLDGHHLAGPLGDLLGQHPDAGADLQHAEAAVDAGGVHDFGRARRGLTIKFCPKPLERAKSYFSHRVRMVARSVSSINNPFSGLQKGLRQLRRGAFAWVLLTVRRLRPRRRRPRWMPRCPGWKQPPH